MTAEFMLQRIAEFCKGTCSINANDWTVNHRSLEDALAGLYADHGLTPEQAHEVHTVGRWFEFCAYTHSNAGCYRVSGPSFVAVVTRMYRLLIAEGYSL